MRKSYDWNSDLSINYWIYQSSTLYTHRQTNSAGTSIQI